MLGWDIRTNSAKYILYFATCALLIAAIFLCRWVQKTKLGTLLLAMRDKEDRVRFSGYDVANFKVFVFCLAAMLCGLGGALFVLQVGFMSASFVGIVPSIEMVIFAAVGGRMSLVGAVYGALLVNFGKTFFSESFPQLWLFLMAALFIGVVMAFPNGLAGLYNDYVKPRLLRKREPRSEPPEPKPLPATTLSHAPAAGWNPSVPRPRTDPKGVGPAVA
jgi:urea transport system permease protein